MDTDGHRWTQMHTDEFEARRHEGEGKGRRSLTADGTDLTATGYNEMMPLNFAMIHDGHADIMRFLAVNPAPVERQRFDGIFRATNHSYGAFLRFFSEKSILSEDDVTVGAHMAYGWMPTAINRFGIDDLPALVRILNDVKRGHFPPREDLATLKRGINNSLVGASKLLHFVAPTNIAIWDRRIARFIHGNLAEREVETIQAFLDYHRDLNLVVRHPDFGRIGDWMNHIVGYQVSNLRACEYLMYLEQVIRSLQERADRPRDPRRGGEPEGR